MTLPGQRPSGPPRRINDHVYCIERGSGQKKAIPLWLIESWVNARIFSLENPEENRVPWRFENHESGVKDYEIWKTERDRLQAEREARARLNRLRGPAPAVNPLDDAMRTAVVADPSLLQPPPFARPGEESLGEKIPLGPQRPAGPTPAAAMDRPLHEPRAPEKPGRVRARDIV